MAVVVIAAALEPVRALNALTPAGSYIGAEGIPYGPDPRHRLDIYQPKAGDGLRRPEHGWPVVVFFYGGSWNHGERAEYRFVGEALAARGMLAMLPDYRLYPFTTRIFSTIARRPWRGRGAKPEILAATAGACSSWDTSAGAYNAAMLALDPRWLASEGLSPKPARRLDRPRRALRFPAQWLTWKRSRCSSIRTIRTARNPSRMRQPLRRRRFSPRQRSIRWSIRNAARVGWRANWKRVRCRSRSGCTTR
ncbi:MAG: hypothetical protein WDN04_26735 [Rhodospirillales bacterium]